MPKRKSRLKKSKKRRTRRTRREPDFMKPIGEGVGRTVGAIAPAVGLGVGFWALGKGAEALPKIGSAVDSLV
jgi:hypothetical protein